MAMRLVGTIAADREVGAPRHGRKQVEESALLRSRHLGPIALHEGGPLAFGFPRLRQLDDPSAWRELREPHVEPVLLRVLALSDTARRAPHSADTQAFAAPPRGT